MPPPGPITPAAGGAGMPERIAGVGGGGVIYPGVGYGDGAGGRAGPMTYPVL